MARKIYVYPDELVEIRIVPEDSFGRNVTSWNDQMHPQSMLVQFNHNRITYNDQSIQCVQWNSGE